MSAGHIIDVEQARNMANERFFVLARLAISERNAIKPLNNTGPLSFLERLYVTGQSMSVGGFFCDHFTALQHLVRAVCVHVKARHEDLCDHVAFEIGINAIDEGCLN